MKWTLGFWKCASAHFPSLIGTFDVLKVIEVFLVSVTADDNCPALLYDSQNLSFLF